MSLDIEKGGGRVNKLIPLLATIAFTLFLLIGCSTSASKEQKGSEAESIEPFEQGQVFLSKFTDEKVAGMKGVIENENLQLFIDDKNGNIAIHHKKTGKVWYSNPPERANDAIATGVNKSLLSAQMQIDFYNRFNQLNSVNTFSDSVANEQIRVEEVNDGIRVTYRFGKTEKSVEDLPLMLSKDRYEELNNKLDKNGQRSLMIAYKENKETNVYERNDSALNGMQLEKALQAFEDAGYTEEHLQEDMAELNFTQENASSSVFEAAIEYTLEENSLVVNVPIERIHYPENYPINRISLLNFFGAAGTEDEGSLLVPDGSGALIHFNNGKTEYPSYQQPVYGEDLALNVRENQSMEQEVRLPVFGILYDTSAVLGIIERGGAPVANIHADISGRLNSYNYIYPSFSVINKDEVTLQANEQERTLPKFQEKPMKTDYTVRYIFLNGDKATYSGMAKSYQEYLARRDGLPQFKSKNNKKDVPFFLDLVGGAINKQKHFVGIPYHALESLTSFEEAKVILAKLKSKNINHIQLKYSGWFNGGVNHKVPTKIKVDDVIGGSKGLKRLMEYTNENDIPLFPDVALLSIYNGGGFDAESEASRTLKGVSAAVYPIDITLNRRDRDKSPSYVVSPKQIEKYTVDMLQNIEEIGLRGLSLRDLADQLNSDFRKNKQIYRNESKEMVSKAFQAIRAQELDLLANGGNAYTLPYITSLTNAPMSNSGYKLEDEEIPFYQMVIRGFINYTGNPYNLSEFTDTREYILKSIEYGSGVHFKWGYAPNHEVKDTEFDYLYSINYAAWMKEAVEIYQEINQVLSQVVNEQIQTHEKLQDGVFKTVYGNGVAIIVNYNQTEVTVDGKKIEAMNYVTVTGGGDEK